MTGKQSCKRVRLNKPNGARKRAPKFFSKNPLTGIDSVCYNVDGGGGAFSKKLLRFRPGEYWYHFAQGFF